MEVSVKEQLDKMLRADNSELCEIIGRYLDEHGFESYVYNDKTTGKLVCLLLDDTTKKKISEYIETLKKVETDKNIEITKGVHFFSYPFVRNFGLHCFSGLSIITLIELLCKESDKFEAYGKTLSGKSEIVSFFEKEITSRTPLFCLMGPSGCGKTSVSNCLEMKGLASVKSYTTRKPRYKGEEGHTFISESLFKKYESEMISKTTFSGAHYGITPELLNQSDIFVVDPAGVKELKKNYKDRPVVVIGLECSRNTCKKRMLERGDSLENANKRIKHDQKAFENYLNYADVIVSADRDFHDVLNNVLQVIRLFSY